MFQHSSPIDVDDLLLSNSADLGPGLALNYFYPLLKPFNEHNMELKNGEMFFLPFYYCENQIYTVPFSAHVKKVVLVPKSCTFPDNLSDVEGFEYREIVYFPSSIK